MKWSIVKILITLGVVVGIVTAGVTGGIAGKKYFEQQLLEKKEKEKKSNTSK